MNNVKLAKINYPRAIPSTKNSVREDSMKIANGGVMDAGRFITVRRSRQRARQFLPKLTILSSPRSLRRDSVNGLKGGLDLKQISYFIMAKQIILAKQSKTSASETVTDSLSIRIREGTKKL